MRRLRQAFQGTFAGHERLTLIPFSAPIRGRWSAVHRSFISLNSSSRRLQRPRLNTGKGMCVPNDSLDDVKRRILTRVNLATLVGETVKLVSRSGKLAGCCPFHNEASPSFYLYDDHYHCFGCKAHGDAITWVREREGLSFVETLRHLAKKYGIEAPELEESQGRLVKNREGAALFHMMAEAQLFFVTMLESPDGEPAREYLLARGFTPASIKEFGFGMTPREPYGLAKHLTNKGYKDGDLRAGGLISSSAGGGRPYDFFRGRVMLPIHDAQGRVIAFGGRTLDGAQPKYLNTGATPLFDKSHTLFGFDKARKKMREKGRAIVVEGYMDTLMLWQQGFEETVACLGTAFTEHHLKTLKNATSFVTLLFDGDSAGQRATLAAVNVAMTVPDVTIKAATLTGDEDPDSFVLKHGKDALEAELAKGVNLLDFAIAKKLKTTNHLAIPDMVATEFVPWLAKLPERLQRGFLLHRIASLTSIAPEIIEQQLHEFARAEQHPSDRPRPESRALAAAPPRAVKPLDALTAELFGQIWFAAPAEVDAGEVRALALRELELDDAHGAFLAEMLHCLENGSSPSAVKEPFTSAMEPAVFALIERLGRTEAAYNYEGEGATRRERIAKVLLVIRGRRTKAQISDLKSQLARLAPQAEYADDVRQIMKTIAELSKNPSP